MQRIFFYSVIFISFLLCGCNNVVLSQEPKSFTLNEEYEKQVIDFLESTQVNFTSGVQPQYIGLTVEGYLSLLREKLEKKVGRSVVNNENIMEKDQLADLLTDVYSDVEIPELLEPSDKDIEKIQADFPLLSKEEILENLPTISLIYQSEVSSLAINKIISLSNPEEISGAQRNIYDNTFDFFGEKITLREVAACLRHPFSALTLGRQKDIAYNLTAQYMNYSNLSDEKSDAFRHAIWNVVMAKEGWGLKNEKMSWAYDFSTSYDQGGKYKGLSSEMDLHNNRVGLNYYDLTSVRMYFRFLWWNIEFGVSEPDYVAACEYIKKKAMNATLVNKDTVTLESGRAKINAVNPNELVYIIPDNKTY